MSETLEGKRQMANGDKTAGEKLAEKWAAKYGIDVNQILKWLLTYGPSVVERVVKAFGKHRPVGADVTTPCPAYVLAQAKAAREKAEEALAMAVLSEHNLLCCGQGGGSA